jgi:hypothetical protein
MVCSEEKIMLRISFHKVVGDPCMIHRLDEVVHLVEATSDDFQVAKIVLLLLELVVAVVIMVPVVDSIAVDMVVNLYG